jgi:hypothetical protein
MRVALNEFDSALGTGKIGSCHNELGDPGGGGTFDDAGSIHIEAAMGQVRTNVN